MIAPEIVFVVSAEGVRIFKIALVSLRSTRAILKILTPSSDTTHPISGQTGTFPPQDHPISTTMIPSHVGKIGPMPAILTL